MDCRIWVAITNSYSLSNKGIIGDDMGIKRIMGKFFGKCWKE